MITNKERVKTRELLKGYDKKLIDRKEIKDIIKKNINIQICLAGFFALNETCHSPENTLVRKIGFLTTDIDKEIDMFKKIFDKFIFLRLYNEKVFCQVSEVNSCVINLFLELKKEGDINKWLEYFTLKEFKNDCVNIMYDKFKYKSNKNIEEVEITKNITIMKKDPYFEYFLDENINCFKEKIIISGFTLKEIEKDKNILTLSKIFDSLYVEIIDGYKFLAW